MFFPITFWVAAGDVALRPHRKRRKEHPIRPLTDVDCEQAAGPLLSRPFVPDPARIDAYREAVAIVNGMRFSPVPTNDEVRAVLQDRALATDTKSYVIFNRSLAHCEPLIQRLAPLLEMPTWQYPVQKEEEAPLKELSEFKRLNMILQAKGRCRWLEGDEEGALTAIGQSARFTERIQDCDSLFIHFLVGQSCKATLLRMFRSTALLRPASDTFLAQLDSIVASVGDRTPPWQKIFEEELCFAIVPNTQLRGLPWEAKREGYSDAASTQAYLLQEILVEWVYRSHPMPLDRKATLELVRELYQAMVPEFEDPVKLYQRLAKTGTELSSGYPEWLVRIFFDPHAAPSLPVLFKASAEMNSRSNPLGTLYMGRVCTVAAQMIVGALRLQAEARAIQVCLAAVRHGLAVGAPQRYQSLQELVDAGFLASIPKDPMWGGAVGFDTEKQLVWFPGPRGLDLKGALDAKASSDGWVWPLNRVTV